MKNHYYPRLEKYKETHKILDWESREAQYARFRVLTGSVELSGRSILDVGCGCGDLLGLFKEEGINVEYAGVDILPGMVEKAREIHEDGLFFCGDLFKDQSFCRDTYDVVFTSGIFNLNLDNNLRFFESAVPVFTRLAEKNLVINLLDEASPDPDVNYFYFDPGYARSILEHSGWNVKIVKDYLNNDFTLIGS